MMTLEKYLTKNFEIFLGGTPFLAPQSAASPKMTTPARYLLQSVKKQMEKDIMRA